jgi:hypothetical protein
MTSRIAYFTKIVVCAIALSLPARAHAREPEPVHSRPEPPRREPRAVPDYDGRGSADEDDDNALLWVPRVLLFPLYVVSEYVVRRPIGWLTVQAERADLVNALVAAFTFGPSSQAGLIPTALVDFGFRPSVGLYFFWDGVLADPNELRVHAATGGKDWLRLTITDRVLLAPGTRLGVRGVGSRRADWLFYGLGPRSQSEDEARFASDMLEASVFLHHDRGHSSHFQAYAGVRHATFQDKGCCGEPSIGARVASGTYPFPPGFERGYTIVRHGMLGELDSRDPAPAPGSGLRLVLNAEQAARTDGAEPRQWIRYGGGIGAYWDVTGYNRVVGLSMSAAFAEPIGSDAPIPFTEQVVLGGRGPLRGFLEGRLMDRSALAVRFDYQWPVWTFLDGSLHAEAGNVFGQHLDGFEPGAMRLSFGLGVRASGSRDHPFEFLVGTATKPIDEGAELDSFRLVLGATSGF